MVDFVPMPEDPKRRNPVALWALLLAIGGMGVNFAFFARPPLQSALPWLSLLLAVVALIFVVQGLRLAIFQSQMYRGKALSIVLSVVTLALSGLTIFGFVETRSLPASAGAPQVGQKVPDFTMADTSGQSISLDSLFAAAPGDSSATAPKAVLLIFYRGYW